MYPSNTLIIDKLQAISIPKRLAFDVLQDWHLATLWGVAHFAIWDLVAVITDGLTRCASRGCVWFYPIKKSRRGNDEAI